MPTSTTCAPSSVSQAVESRLSEASAIDSRRPDEMPDALQPSAPDRADLDAAEVDARLVRSVRRRLVLWSGGTTLLVLLVLAAALYLSVASTLEAAGGAVLNGRAGDIVAAIRHERQSPEGPPTEFSFGGGGTVAVV